MPSPFLYHLYTSLTLLILSLHHLISTTTRHHLSLSVPLHPLPTRHPLLRLLPHLSISLSLLLSILHHLSLSPLQDPLLPSHSFHSLTTSLILFLFLALTFTLTLSELGAITFPSDLAFAFGAAFFYLGYIGAVSLERAIESSSGLEGKIESISGLISVFCAGMCGLLAVNQRLFVVDLGLGAGVGLKGLWALQTGLTLYVEGFIPEGCHRSLNVASGVEGATKCELEESRVRAVALLDLMFVVYVGVVSVVVLLVYVLVGRCAGSSKRFSGGNGVGSYEALPVSGETNVIQLKTLSGTQA
ncbi:hypothetical protein Droror1_Dr00021699 [Drosera rotundifolia]